MSSSLNVINTGTPVTMLAATSDGRYVLSNGVETTAVVWDLSTGQTAHRLDHSIMASYSPIRIEMKSDRAVALTVLDDNHRAICASASSVRIWDIKTGEVVRTLLELPRPTPDSAMDAYYSGILFDFSQQDDFTGLLISADSAKALLTTTRSWTLLGMGAGDVTTLATGALPERIMAVLPDGYRVLSVVDDTVLKLWDLKTGATLRVPGDTLATLVGHSSTVTCVAVLPSGREAVSSSTDGTLIRWDLELGRAVSRSSRQESNIRVLAVLADGRRVVSGSEDGVLALWDLQRLGMLRTFRGHEGPVTAIAVQPAGQAALSGSQDGTIRRWPLPAFEET